METFFIYGISVAANDLVPKRSKNNKELKVTESVV